MSRGKRERERERESVLFAVLFEVKDQRSKIKFQGINDDDDDFEDFEVHVPGLGVGWQCRGKSRKAATW